MGHHTVAHSPGLCVVPSQGRGLWAELTAETGRVGEARLSDPGRGWEGGDQWSQSAQE